MNISSACFEFFKSRLSSDFAKTFFQSMYLDDFTCGCASGCPVISFPDRSGMFSQMNLTFPSSFIELCP